MTQLPDSISVMQGALIAYYPLKADAIDLGPHHHDPDSRTHPRKFSPGRFGPAATFTGTDDGGCVLPELGPLESLGLSVWVRIADTSQVTQPGFEQITGPLWFDRKTGRAQFRAPYDLAAGSSRPEDAPNVTSTKRLDDGEWHHVAASWDSTTTIFPALFIDGVVDVVGDSDFPKPEGSYTGWHQPFQIGGSRFTGQVGDLFLFACALNQECVDYLSGNAELPEDRDDSADEGTKKRFLPLIAIGGVFLIVLIGHIVSRAAAERAASQAAPPPSPSTPPPVRFTVVRIDVANDDATTVQMGRRKKGLLPAVEAVADSHSQALEGAAATIQSVARAIAPTNSGLVTASGHGAFDALLGFNTTAQGDSERILTAASVGSAARGKIFHLFACSTGTSLGPRLVENGAIAFFGYVGAYELELTRDKTTLKVTRDNVYPADWWFCDADIAVDLALLEGGTVKDAHERYMDTITDKKRRLIEGGFREEAERLEANRMKFVSPVTDSKYGHDKGARLETTDTRRQGGGELRR